MKLPYASRLSPPYCPEPPDILLLVGNIWENATAHKPALPNSRQWHYKADGLNITLPLLHPAYVLRRPETKGYVG